MATNIRFTIAAQCSYDDFCLESLIWELKLWIRTKEELRRMRVWVAAPAHRLEATPSRWLDTDLLLPLPPLLEDPGLVGLRITRDCWW